MIAGIRQAIRMQPSETFPTTKQMQCDAPFSDECLFAIYDGRAGEAFLFCTVHGTALRCVDPNVGTTHEQMAVYEDGEVR